MDEKQDVENDEDVDDILHSCRSFTAYEDKSLKAALPQIFAAFSAASIHITIGMSLAYSAILIPQLFEEQTIRNATSDGIEINKESASWIASILTIATIPSALVGGILIDNIGRLHLIRVASVPTLLGWILIATADSMTMLIIGRILTGIPSTWGTASGAAYITEIASPSLRGSLVSFNSLSISLGFILIYAEGSFLNWRTVAWICMVFSMLPLILLIFIPESPSWLIMKGRNEEALKSLKWLNKYQNPTLTGMQFSMQHTRTLTNKKKQEQIGGNSFVKKAKLFLNPTCYKPLLIVVGIFFFQQFTGVYMTLFYAVNFMQDVGADINPYIASIYLGAGRFGTAIVNIWLFRYCKRRHMLFVGTLGMGATMAISAMFTNWIHEGKTTHTWVPVAMPVLYVTFSMIGLLSLPFLFAAELFPLEVRGIAQSAILCLSNLIIFVALKSYFVLEELFGGVAGLQYYFAAMSLAAFVYTFIFVPETHKKKLTEIEDYFRHHTTYLSFNDTATHNKIRCTSVQ